CAAPSGQAEERAASPAPQPASPSAPPSPTPSERPMTGDEGRLRAAAEDGDLDALQEELDAGVDVDDPGDQGETALFHAVVQDHADVAEALVDAGADPDALNEEHDSPSLMTGVTGSTRMLDVLLEADPDITEVNRVGGTALIPACERGHAEYVRAILERTDVDVDHMNSRGWTALIEAVVFGDGSSDHQEIVRLLVDAGVDTDIADGVWGTTPLQHARDRGYTEIAGILADAGAS